MKDYFSLVGQFYRKNNSWFDVKSNTPICLPEELKKLPENAVIAIFKPFLKEQKTAELLEKLTELCEIQLKNGGMNGSVDLVEILEDAKEVLKDK